MLARTETNLAVTERWLAQLERALSDRDDALLKTLFHPDSHWRDVLALTWRITTVNGRDAILRELRTHSERARPVGFKIPPHRAALRPWRPPQQSAHRQCVFFSLD
jgi:putative flavoprotein involved in K+ transport